eukprot:TRINITY_DN3673_c0_g1_i1.p1 TRINITY_DN3673_c0_g1~~TRINITY_DN3673_c0_g1_i1.p1  ORF type:complete len:300 (-),score=77.51 TRINITY_DN3673_c0_g1_i1:89-922(-)
MNYKVLLPIGPGFWNIRAPFKIMHFVDIQTHMSIGKLQNGNFLVIDAVPLSPELKSEIDHLTDNGSKIEGVVHTHPFHTLNVQRFHDAYPNAPIYGCPRHIRKFPELKWSGNLEDCEIRNKWSPDFEFRIPAGAEFVNPLPEKTNHFICVFAFHKESKTLHVDDTIMFSEDPGFLLKAAGLKKGSMSFHPSIKGPGLLHDPDAPFHFRDWLKQVINDWDFDNIVTAHVGNKIGGAKAQLIQTLDNAAPLFQKLHEKRKEKGYVPDETSQHYSGEECG